MRMGFSIAVALVFLGAGVAVADAPHRFEVPQAADFSSDIPTHEVLLPADIVARPGETPSTALARALREADCPTSTGKSQ